jgi:selenium metabolism protein YedF
MKNFKVDGRGLDCPKPLLRTKEALEQEDFDTITVLVGNVPARENVLRFLKHSEMEGIEWRDMGNDEYSISAIRGKEGASSASGKDDRPSGQSAAPAPRADEAAGKTVLIASSRMGMGKKELGSLLMKGYIYTLTQLDVPPRCIIFMNTGVKLTLQDSESLDDLRSLEEKGVKMLVCGTCLDFLNVRDQMKIGMISNMYEIASELHAPGELISFT